MIGWYEWLTGLWRPEDGTSQHRGQISGIENNSGNVLVTQNSAIVLGYDEGNRDDLRKPTQKAESPEFS